MPPVRTPTFAPCVRELGTDPRLCSSHAMSGDQEGLGAGIAPQNPDPKPRGEAASPRVRMKYHTEDATRYQFWQPAA